MSAISSTLRQITMTKTLPEPIWRELATKHVESMLELLYPAHASSSSLKNRVHLISKSPVYNFLHVYYRYSVMDLLAYSPGVNIRLEGCRESDIKHGAVSFDSVYKGEMPILSSKYLNTDESGSFYGISSENIKSVKAFDMSAMIHSKLVLEKTISKPPFYACFGLHEWAMMYSGGKGATPLPRHQSGLDLRVKQETIDAVVEGGVRCTHFDAFRFFHPQAKLMNIVNPISKSMQPDMEQPGCVHANMDLFKHAYTAYPLIDADLLRDCLRIAIAARKIDMRASPYSVSHIAGCEEAICVETVEGRKVYATEQEALANIAMPVRQRLLEAYNLALHDLPSIL